MADRTTSTVTQMSSHNIRRQQIDLCSDDDDDDVNGSTLIFNLCSDMAKKIKDQAVDVIGHRMFETTSKA